MSWEDFDLSAEYDDAASGNPSGAVFSGHYLRIIRRAVLTAFWKLERLPHRDYCDADIDDVAQETIVRLLWFFRERGVKPETERLKKTSYLFGLARQIARWQTLKFYQYRDFNRKDRSGEQSRLHFVEPEKLRNTPAPTASNGSLWGPFEEKARNRFSPAKAAALISLASTDSLGEAARNIGVCHTTVMSHRKEFKEIFAGKRPGDLFGGLEPRVCEACGGPIDGVANSRHCSKDSCRTNRRRLFMKAYNASYVRPEKRKSNQSEQLASSDS
ncbi:MAG: hypothetical protein AAFX06_20050 [Planctomycetota bacterium]